jgi:cytochrome c oxidase accessory protein FixG
MAIERRPRTLDEKGNRRVVHPTEARGVWHSRRTIVQIVLLVFFLVLPWIRMGGRPLLLLDVIEGRFSIFGVLFRAHDVPIAFLFVLAFLLGFALLTALFGRVWCGWTCPQTVFIDLVFRRIEQWAEGNAFERRKQDRLPLDGDRILRKVAKWSGYLLASGIITHSFLALFTGPEKMRAMIAAGPGASPAAFGFILVSTAIILLDFGWMREQFCIYICPYGRIQSIFQDSATKTVAYDVKRGEPRGPKSTGLGDCVDCSRCVQVCPTGIDIRNGSSQLECIACTACMDACDDVMGRLAREKGLIRYASNDELEKGKPARTIWFRGRVLAYFFFLLATIGGIATIVQSRPLLRAEVFKTRGAPFIEVPEGDDRAKYANLFMVELSNQNDFPIEITVALVDAERRELRFVMPNNPLRLEAGALLKNPLTIRFSKSEVSGGRGYAKIEFTVRGAQADTRDTIAETFRREVTLVGPY